MSNPTEKLQYVVPSVEPPRIADREELEPRTMQIYEALEHRAIAAGLNLVLLETVRTRPRQRYLYAIGRTLHPERRVVTHAKPGETWHDDRVRRAFDVVLLDAQGKAWWDAPVERWERLGVIGKGLGLTWGGDFKGLRDYGHFQNDTMTLEEAKQLANAGRAERTIAAMRGELIGTIDLLIDLLDALSPPEKDAHADA